jgi:hypothetical protein
MTALIRLCVFGTTIVVFLLGLADSCEINVPQPTACGEFDFPSPERVFLVGGRVYPGPGRVSIGFTFHPEACGAAPCRCQRVVFVQAIRFTLPPRVIKQPHAEQTNRMTRNETPIFDGWAIDTSEHAIYPYYGMENDGSFLFDPINPSLFKLTEGSTGSRAVLRDSPFSTEWEPYSIEAISVPVCIDSQSTCNNRILGYYTWGWTVPDNNKPDSIRFFHNPAATDLYVQAFDLAVQAWNDHVDNGRKPLQLSRLP